MNPGGPAEEAGKVASSFIEAMKGQPLALALCMMNLVLLGLFWYVIRTATDVRHKEMERVFAAQAETNKLLFNCVPSDRRGDFRLQSDESHPFIPTPMPQPRPAEAPPQ